MKPEKTYRNFEEFRIASGVRNLPKGKEHRCPCPTCQGRGTIVDPKAYCDPVEGYKMADHVTCGKCDGTGIVLRAVLVHEWQKIVADYHKELARWRVREDYRKSGLAKLTANEMRALDL